MNEWKQAIDHELTNIHLTADSFSSPKEAVKVLIDWYIEVGGYFSGKKEAAQSGQRAGERECRHCGWVCRPNDVQTKPWYPLVHGDRD
jgi:hypothetical protein